MSVENRTPIVEIAAPYRRAIRLEEVDFESGMRMLRVVLREGHRITQIDLDAETAARWGTMMADWAARQPGGDTA
ncbi:MAG TPA: hypothetical protein PK812_03215 [Beijerinckiaceae bacterium]|nr:hypothetical protein [Beijerinckiaceae bacterium]